MRFIKIALVVITLSFVLITPPNENKLPLDNPYPFDHKCYYGDNRNTLDLIKGARVLYDRTGIQFYVIESVDLINDFEEEYPNFDYSIFCINSYGYVFGDKVREAIDLNGTNFIEDKGRFNWINCKDQLIILSEQLT